MTYCLPWLILAAFPTAVLGVGRLTRLITYDDYPPTIWLRIQWLRLTKDGGWGKLATCYWCLAPWVMLPCIAWAIAGWYWGGAWAWTWWLFWVWLGLSYLTSMIVARDEPRE